MTYAARFYGLPRAQELYRQHITHVLSWRNTVNGSTTPRWPNWPADNAGVAVVSKLDSTWISLKTCGEVCGCYAFTRLLRKTSRQTNTA